MRVPRIVILSACAFVALAQTPSQAGSASQVDAIKALIAKYAAAVNAEPVDINLAAQVWEIPPEFDWHFTAKLRSSGAPVETNGRETQVYRKIGPDRWALVHVHYSAVPASPAPDTIQNAEPPK